MKSFHKQVLFAGVLGTIALLASPSYAAQIPGFGAAADFTVLSAAPNHGGAVTCTDSTIIGDVGSSGLPASVVETRCTITGAIIAPVSAQVIADFESAYGSFADA